MTSRTLPDGRIPRGSLDPKDEERMYATIGRVVTAFGGLELELDEYLVDLLKLTNPKPRHCNVTKMNSFWRKVDLLKQLVCQHLHSDEPSNELTKLCAMLKSVCDRRDDIVHSICLPFAGARGEFHQRWTPGRERKKDGVLTPVSAGVFTMRIAEVEDALCVIRRAEAGLHGLMDNAALWVPNNTLVQSSVQKRR